MKKRVLILAVLIGVAIWLAAPRISSGLFGYDEADYMFAAQFGPTAHWLDLGAMPLVDYVQIGLGPGRDPQQRLAISEIGRAGNDPNVYRHWHGPVYWYWLGFIRNFTEDEHTLRWFSLFFPVIAAITLYFGTLRILPEDSGPPAALLSTALFLWSPATLETTELAPHMAFVFFSMTALLFLSKVMIEGTRRDWYAAVVAAGLAFCTLEVTFVLLAVLAIVGWRQRRALAVDLRLCGTSLALLIAAILAIWPAGLLKLTFAKAYLFMAYLALFRKAAWGDVGFAGAWALRFALSPMEWILIGVGLALFFWRWREPAARAAEPFVWFALLMVLTLLRVNGEGPRYSVTFLFALDVAAGWMIASALPFRESRARYAIVFGMVVLLGAVSAWKLSRYHPDGSPRLRSILASIRTQGGENLSILAPQDDLPSLHYYLPRAQIHGYLGPADTQNLHAVLVGQLPCIVIYPGNPPRVRRLEIKQ